MVSSHGRADDSRGSNGGWRLAVLLLSCSRCARHCRGGHPVLSVHATLCVAEGYVHASYVLLMVALLTA